MKTALISSFPAAIAAGLLSAAEPVALFDASGSLDAWTMDKEGAWVAVDGELQPAAEGAGGYLWSREKFSDFTLSLEFKMSEKCNSGVFFRTDPKNPVQGGFEIQIFDSAGKEDVTSHDCGALYDTGPPLGNAAKPAGEWNTLVLDCQGPRIIVTLNGQAVVDADIDQWTESNRNPDGSKNKFSTPLKDLPRDNHIGLQYHGHPVWFRDIVIQRR